MKTTKVLSLLLLSVFLSSSVFAQKKTELTPRKSLAKVVLKGKGEYTYYALSEKNTTEYAVTGPGKIYVNYRVRLTDNQFESKPFKVKHIRSGKQVAVQEVPKLVAGNLKFKSKSLTGTPTKQHRDIINVPPGKHTYRFYKYRESQKVSMRLFYSKEATPSWKQITAASSIETKQVRFKQSGQTRDYYELTKNKDFDFVIHENRHIRMILRPEFTYNMLSETVLRIKLTDVLSGESTVYKINSRKSGSSEFVNDSERTPGKSSTVYLHLDTIKGQAKKYRISLLSGAKSAVIRVSYDSNYVPAKSIATK